MPITEHVTLSPEQLKALDAMLSGANCFITGEAGTGKTTAIKAYLKQTVNYF